MILKAMVMNTHKQPVTFKDFAPTKKRGNHKLRPLMLEFDTPSCKRAKGTLNNIPDVNSN